MYTITLPQAADFKQAGGKAANLARAMRSGFPVPDGFVLSNEALRLFLQSNQFLPRVEETVLQDYNGLPWQTRLDRFEALCSAVMKLPIPIAIQEEVEPFVLDLLKYSPAGVAVRSSGVCEDLEKASFSGIYESVLAVTDLETFWQAALRCWCSTWSPQAAAYAQKMDLTLPLDGMAVLVQTMIPADSAGVIFTADPSTGNPWRFVLNATFGLAQKLVDGSAPADRFVLAWDTTEIQEKRIVKKPGRLVIQGQKMIEESLPNALQQGASLSDEQAREVGQLALSIDRIFNRRVDIEWAFAEGRLYLLQARPLTALPPFFPHELSEEDAIETWTPYLNEHGTMNEHERLIAPFHRHRWLLAMWNYHLTEDDVFPHRIGQERDFNGYRYTTTWKWGGRAPDWLRIEQWLEQHEPRLRRDWLDQIERVRQVNDRLDQRMAAVQGSRSPCAADWLRLILPYEREEYKMQTAVWYASQWLIFTCEELLQRFLDEVMPAAGIPNLPAGLLQGLVCRSAELTIAAQRLGCSIREDFVRAAFKDLSLGYVLPFLMERYPDCAFLRDLHVFCFTYGKQPPEKLKPQGEDLEGVLLTIKTSLLGQAADAQTLLAESVARRQAIETQVRHWLHDHRPDQLDRFNKLLDWAQFWTPALDNRRWHLTLSVRLRKLYRQTQAALIADGLVDQPDHFFLLTPGEWADYVNHPDPASLRSLYQQRQHEYERNRRLEPLPYLGKPPASQEARSETPADQVAQPTGVKRIFQGEGIAPGKARGVAYLLNSSNPNAIDDMDRLTSEHILICGRDTFNAQWRRDWYSLFMIVRGLVTVQGAQLHHAAQISRECGIPFINLPNEELVHLPNGIVIEIDGQAGTLVVV